MKKVLNMTFASSLTNLCEVNSSFDTGIMKIAYVGDNRNHSSISKESFEKCIKTMYNCPIVCNYDRETDTLGGHDMALVRDSEGELRLINVTTPIGCIPESARTWFEEVEEEDGTVHEYLFAEALLWKRQEAYRKIKKDGITAHSMEITVKDSVEEDGILYIKDFEFTAFCLIGCEPCYEGASLEMFSKQDFKEQFSMMMQDLKDSFNLVTTSKEDDNIHPQQNLTEGGIEVLDKKMELAAKYGIDVDSLDFSLEDFTEEELKEKFEAMKADGEPAGDGDGAGTDDGADNGDSDNKFALTGNIVNELCNSLAEITIEREWGECHRYCYVDCDFEAKEVYCWDVTDWLLYGFAYEMNGDNVVIDYDSKKRMKYAIVDFDEGEQASPFAEVFTQLEEKLHNSSEWEAKYNTASETIASMETELGELRQFKADTEAAVAEEERQAIFDKFEDLAGIEAFEALRDDCSEYDTETLEEKCYAIRGRNGSKANFALEAKTPKIKVIKTETTEEPYGGLFEKYGSNNK